MQTVIPGGPPDLIAYAWFQIGYRPRSSVILVGVRGPRLRTGLVARADLPPPRGRSAGVARLTAMIRRAGDEAVIALIVADPGPRGDLLTQRPLLRAIRQQVGRAGLGLLDVLAVGEETYRSYLCDDTACCPAQGHPLAEVMSSSTAAQMVLEGRVVSSGEADVVADVTPDPVPFAGLPRRSRRPAPPARLADWMARWRAALLDQLAGPGDGRPGPCDGRPGPAAGSGPSTGPEAGGAPLAWLVTALEDHSFRDAVLVTLAVPQEPDPFDPAKADVGQAIPQQAVLRAGTSLLATVARGAPAGRRAEALAALAWIAWWTGGGARARLLTGLALADQPEHRLAGLIGQLLVASVPPPWVDRAREELEEVEDGEAEWAETAEW